MTKLTAREYQRASPKDQREFDKWLNSNAIVSSIFAVGMLAMVVAGIGTVVANHTAKLTIVPAAAASE